MASPTLVVLLFSSAAISLIAMGVIFRSWWKNRLLTSFLYVLAIACFAGMALDMYLDQVFMPFRNWSLNIGSETIWVSNLLLAFLLVGGFIFWYFAVLYSQYESLPPRSNAIAFLAGAALLAELEAQSWSALFPLIIEAIAFGTFIVEIIRYGRRVSLASHHDNKRQIHLHFSGFLVWLMAGPLGVILGNTPGVPSWIGDLWPIPYGVGLFMVAYSVAVNPRLLILSEAKPLDLLILDKNGNLVVAQRFEQYPQSVDSELMGSALSGVLSLMQDMLASKKDLERIDHGDVKIILEHGILTTFILVATLETPALRQSLRNLLMEFETNYRDGLLEDTGLVSSYDEFKDRTKRVLI